MPVLRILVRDDCPNRDRVLKYYQNTLSSTSYTGDSGVDIIFTKDQIVECNKVTMVQTGISVQLIDSEGTSLSSLLMPRSSIVKTPLMLANSVGLLDAGYRGEIFVPLRCFVDKSHPSTLNDSNYQINFGDRLVQIVSPNLSNMTVEIVEELEKTERGEKGFGSTN